LEDNVIASLIKEAIEARDKEVVRDQRKNNSYLSKEFIPFSPN
jgi:hypothetical protein